MRATIRRKLKMVRRVRDFIRAHPSKAESFTSLASRLEELLGRADALITQQRSGSIMEKAATQRRDKVRRILQTKLLPHLVRVGEAAAEELPELLDRFALPRASSTNPAFVAAARAMFADATTHRELLLKHGMEESLLKDIEDALTTFEGVTVSGHEGRREHVGAKADLEVVTAGLVSLVQRFDAQNRYRFKDDPELLAAWISARNIVGPFKSGEEDGTTPGDPIAPAA